MRRRVRLRRTLAALVAVRVYIDGKLRKTARARRIKRVTLARLPEGLFRVKIVARTANGQRVTSVRTYRGCVKSRARTNVKRGHRHRH